MGDLDRGVWLVVGEEAEEIDEERERGVVMALALVRIEGGVLRRIKPCQLCVLPNELMVGRTDRPSDRGRVVHSFSL